MRCFSRSAPRRVTRQLAQRGARVGRRVVRAGDADPERPRAARGQLELVGEPAAGALAERAVVALLRHRRRASASGAVAAHAVRAVVARADRAGHGLAIGADHRGVGVRSRLARELPGVAEDEPAVRVGAGVGRVVARPGDDVVEAPRVLAHQLGVRVDLDAHGARPVARVAQLEPEQRAAHAVRRDVGALHVDPRRARQVVADVAGAARELRRLADPLAVDPERDRVEQLERGRDDAAHLPRDVPALGVEPPVLEPEDLGPRARRDLAAVVESLVRPTARRPPSPGRRPAPPAPSRLPQQHLSRACASPPVC